MRTSMLRAALAIGALTLTGPGLLRADEGGCHSYAGEFTAVTPAECPSFCTHGTLTGDLAGSYLMV